MSRLDTRIPLQVPNTLAQGAQISAMSAADQGTRNALATQMRNDAAAPIRRNALAAQAEGQDLQNLAGEREILGQVVAQLEGMPEQQRAAMWPQAAGYLAQNGVIDPQLADIEYTPELMLEMKTMAAPPVDDRLKPTAGMQEYQFARQQGYGGSFAEWKASNKSGTSVNINTAPGIPEYSKLGPGLAYKQNKDGSLQTDNNGNPIAVPIQGTGAERDQQESDAARRKAVNRAADDISVIDSFLNHPGFDRIYGSFDTKFGRIPLPDEMIPNIPGGDAANAEGFLAQIGGLTFLQAFESLKGGGPITDVEGAKASDAMSRAQNRLQSPESARKALLELRAIAERAMNAADAPQAGGFDEVKSIGGKNYVKRGGKWFIQP